LAVNVSDLVKDDWAGYGGANEIGEELGSPGGLEVWGLTGWYMGLLMKVLRVY
jgi:hypothetical protein